MIKTYLFTNQQCSQDVSLEQWRDAVKADDALLWVDVRSYDRDEINHLAELFGIHTLAVGSLLDGYRRPHLYEFADYFYMNLTTFHGGKRGRNGKPKELHVFAGEKLVITAAAGDENRVVDGALEAYRSSPSVSVRGPMYAVYLLAEDLVESYYPLVEKLDEDADRLESELLNKPDKRLLDQLFALKRRNYEFRKLMGPQRDLFSELARRDFPFIQGEQQVYSQDLFNRMNRLFDMLDIMREILSGAMDVYLSGVSNRLNEIMKVLTVAATILGMLTFITGFFGMNFVHLPWLESRTAVRGVGLAMVMISLTMLGLFKWKKWI